MKKHFVLTVIGPDHPGIVGRLSATLSHHQASWLDSRMANLAGEFAGILHGEVPSQQFPALLQDLMKLRDEDVQIVVREPSPSALAGPNQRHLALEVVGTDRTGIVRDISAVLSQFAVNVEEMSTTFGEAPMSAAPIFRTTARLSAALQIDLEALQTALETIANDLMIELRVEPSPGRGSDANAT